MKKIFCLTVIMLLGLFAAEVCTAQAKSLPVGEAAVYYNGRQQEFNAWIKDGASLLPIRDICNMFDVSVAYSAAEKKVRIYNSVDFFVIDLKTGAVLRNGEQAAPLPVAPQMRNDKLYLPLRYVGDLLGVQVAWNEDFQRVELYERAPVIVVNENGVLTGLQTSWSANQEPLAVAVPTGVVEIGEQAFSGAKIDEIEMIDAADTLRKIGFAAFYSTKLKRVNIPDGVSEIEAWAFNACWDLEEIKLPAELKVLRQEVFAETNLRRLIVPQKVEVIEANIFNLHTLHMSPHYTPIELVVLPPSVKEIHDDAFAYCYDLVLEGLAGSYAEEYAKAGGLTFKAISEQELAAYYK